MSKYKAGETYFMTVILELEVTPENDCDDSGMSDYVVDALLACEDVAQALTEYSLVDDAVSRETNEESPEWLAAKEAVKLWDKLRGLRGAVDLKNFPDLNEKQIQFVCDVIAAGKTDKLRTYSGRGMFGRHCPGVVVTHPSEVPTKARYSQDSLGMGTILYMP